MCRLSSAFFQQDALVLAPLFLGKKIHRKQGSLTSVYTITEVEVYRGEEDSACHACKGRTARTEMMYQAGGVLYVYLIYGMHWMLNIVTGPADHPQAILIRGVEGVSGPGRVGKVLGVDKGFTGEPLCFSERIWLEEGDAVLNYHTSPRIGIDYATEEFRLKPWRYTY